MHRADRGTCSVYSVQQQQQQQRALLVLPAQECAMLRCLCVRQSSHSSMATLRRVCCEDMAGAGDPADMVWWLLWLFSHSAYSPFSGKPQTQQGHVLQRMLGKKNLLSQLFLALSEVNSACAKKLVFDARLSN